MDNAYVQLKSIEFNGEKGMSIVIRHNVEIDEILVAQLIARDRNKKARPVAIAPLSMTAEALTYDLNTENLSPLSGAEFIDFFVDIALSNSSKSFRLGVDPSPFRPYLTILDNFSFNHK